MQRLSFLSSRALGCALALGLGAASASAATLPSGFTETTWSGITNPTALAHAPDGRVFVSQQCGALRVIKNGTLISTPFATLPVSCSDERGLHSIAFDPNFASNGYVYVRFTRASPTNNVIGRLKASAPGSDVSDGTVTILFVVPFRSNRYHHGGGLIVGNDGKLYSSFGDHESGSGQNLANLWGKIVRINIPNGDIPTDNPFYTTTTGDNRAIWAYGFRNAFTMAIQPVTGRIHENDVGNQACCGKEEVNNITRGTNYNWPNSEGTGSYFSYTAADQGGNAIVGGTFYNPPTVNFPSSNVGRYFFADYGGGWIRSIVGSGSPGSLTSFASGISGPTDVETAADGTMWYTARNSSNVRRICFGTCPPLGGPTPTPTPTTPPSEPPVCTITAPASGTQYSGGDQVCFTGSCTDPETGAIAPSGYHWESVFHHNTHIHPGSTVDGVTSVCITLPVSGEWDPNQWWRMHLTATDPAGTTSGDVYRDILPRTQSLTLATDPAGLQVSADGVAGAGPFTTQAVVGMVRFLDTQAPQGVYHFTSWSDGGVKRHEIVMPATATTYTANFRPASEYSEVTPAGSGVTTSTSDTNVGAGMVDNDLATRWSGNGDGAWARFDLGGVMNVGHVRVAAYQGNVRRNRFDIQLSTDGSAWSTVYSGETSGTTTNEETFDFVDTSARYVRYLGHGNVGSTNPTMNSVTEVSIFGGTACTSCPTPTPTPTSPTVTPPPPTPTPTNTPLPPAYEEVTPGMAGATASTNDGNVPGNAVDNDLLTRWSGNGDGAWLQLDIGSTRTLGYVKISFFNGHLRSSRFDIQVSGSASGPWTNALTNATSGGTSTNEETFDFTDVDARYLRYLGHGNNSLDKPTWNSLQEVSIYASTGVVLPTPTPEPTSTPTPVTPPPPTPTPTVTSTPTPTPPVSSEITPAGVTASTNDGNMPANAADNNLATRWSGSGDGAWLLYDLGANHTVTHITLATYNGNARQTMFDLQVGTSPTGPWTNVLTGGITSGTTTNEELFDFPDTSTRYFRYLGHMNTVNAFNSVTELSVFGSACTSCPTPIPPTPTPTATPTLAPNQVSIVGMSFSPATITIQVGQSVTWVNTDSVPHTSTSDTSVWDSATIGAGASFTRAFTTPGTFPYHCSFHPGMTGTVVVQGGTPVPFVLKSSAFVDNAVLPIKYTCQFDGGAGVDISPPLNWGPGTMNAQAYAIVFADTANAGNKLHWMIWDIKPSQLALAEGLPAGYNVPNNSPAKQKGFTSGAATLSFFGPCPGGSEHPYAFRLYAQNVATIPGVTSASTVTQIEAAIKANSSTTISVLRARSSAAQ